MLGFYCLVLGWGFLMYSCRFYKIIKSTVHSFYFISSLYPPNSCLLIQITVHSPVPKFQSPIVNPLEYQEHNIYYFFIPILIDLIMKKETKKDNNKAI